MVRARICALLVFLGLLAACFVSSTAEPDFWLSEPDEIRLLTQQFGAFADAQCPWPLPRGPSPAARLFCCLLPFPSSFVNTLLIDPCPPP